MRALIKVLKNHISSDQIKILKLKRRKCPYYFYYYYLFILFCHSKELYKMFKLQAHIFLIAS
jgi:hypothetical protein